MDYDKIEGLSKAKLFELFKIYAKNWLVHDGFCFLAVENALGFKKAIEFGCEAWENFAVIEVRRIREFLNLPENGGLRNLQKALQFRLYSIINEQESDLKMVYFALALKPVVFNKLNAEKDCQISIVKLLVLLNIHFLLRKLILTLRLKASRVCQMFPNPITIVYGNLK